jgi:tetratricopeptide (TPR) repeat protein
VNERRILLAGAVVLFGAGLFVLPAVLKRTARAPGSAALSVPGPRVAEPGLGGPGGALPDSAPAASGGQSEAEASGPVSLQEAGSALELGNLAYEKQEFEAAIRHFRKYLESHEDAEVMTSLAICLRRTGRVQEALPLLERSLELRPDGLEARYYLGLVQQYDLADFDAAIQTFELVLPHLPPEHLAELKQNVEYMRRVRENLARKLAPKSDAAPAADSETPGP